MFKTEMMNGVDYKRFVRYFYDPAPKYNDMSGTSIWCLGNEYKSIPPKAVTTTDHDDIVEVESSADSRDASEATVSTSEEDTQQVSQQTLGTSFDDISSGNVPMLSNDPQDGGWPLPFLDDFESRIWMTYRSGFPPIPRSADPSASSSMTFAVRLRNLAEKDGFSTDTGWGCMIRSGQSMLANTLILLQQGREWRHTQQHTTETVLTEAKILSLFADYPSAPFSIHRFVSHGAAACGKHPGQWFGPSATAACIAALSTECAAAGLRVYVTPNTSDVYEDRFRRLSAKSEIDPNIIPTLILLGTRLGPDRITPVYYEALKQSFTLPQSVGIAGGRPSSSHYFVGCQGDTFFYLDPHETRPALPYHPEAQQYTAEELSTYHTRRLRGLKINEVDPSMLIGFLIKDEADWQDFKRRLNEVRGKKIVNIFDKEPPIPGQTVERKEAVDEVETFDDEDDDDARTETGD
ncbi:hypothetical protein R6Q59_010182 [Mikania micrantha]